MPIQIDQVETQVDVEAPGATHEAPRMRPAAEDLARWLELARREAQLAHRTAAWDFDD